MQRHFFFFENIFGDSIFLVLLYTFASTTWHYLLFVWSLKKKCDNFWVYFLIELTYQNLDDKNPQCYIPLWQIWHEVLSKKLYQCFNRNLKCINTQCFFTFFSFLKVTRILPHSFNYKVKYSSLFFVKKINCSLKSPFPLKPDLHVQNPLWDKDIYSTIGGSFKLKCNSNHIYLLSSMYYLQWLVAFRYVCQMFCIIGAHLAMQGYATVTVE